MKKKDGNVVHSFPDIWNTFLAFESVSRSQDESLDDFLGRWQENMCSAQSTGCDFSDTFLACKLLQKVNLDQNVLKKIVNSLAGTKSELLYKLLSKLDDFLGDKSQRDKSQITDQAEPNGVELEKVGHSKRIQLSQENILMSVQVKHETSEAPKPPAQLDFSNLLDKTQDLADNFEDDDSASQIDNQYFWTGKASSKSNPSVTSNQKQDNVIVVLSSPTSHVISGNECLVKDPLDTEGDDDVPDDVPDVPKNILADSEQEVNEIKAEERKYKDHLANKKDVTDNSMVDEDMEEYPSSSLQPVEEILEEFELEVKEGGIDEFPLLAIIPSNQPIQQWHTNERPHKCTICSYASVEKNELNFHMYKHTEEQPSECTFCDKTFKCEKFLKTHIKRSHADKEMPLWNIKPFYKCSQCNFKATEKLELAQHSLVHVDDQPWKCPSCDLTFKSEDLMNRHVTSSHIDKEQNLTVKGPPYQCSHCYFITQHKYNFVNHIRIHTGERPFKCPDCPKRFTRKSMTKSHRRRWHTNERPHKCTLCNYASVEKGDLTIHMYKHTEERPFECTFCDKAFKCEKFLKTHVKKLHADKELPTRNIKPLFKCSQCDFKATNMLELTQHSLVHVNDQPWKCPSCDLTFKSEDLMNCHIKTSHIDKEQQLHTKERSYKCTQCDYRAVEESELTFHLNTHSGEKPFECSLCNKSFTTGRNLDIHKNDVHAHEGSMPTFECPYCSFTSRLRQTIFTHILSHMKEKPFKCPECSRAFKEKSNMLNHRRTHGWTPTYKCRFCEETFTEKKTRSNHVKTMHAIESESFAKLNDEKTHGWKPTYKCRFCKETFTEKKARSNHVKTTHAIESVAKLNDEKENRENETGSVIKDEKGPKDVELSQCEYCGVYRKIMKLHHAKCHGMSEDSPRQVPEKKQCEYCGNYYASQVGLKTHYGVCPNIGDEERKAKGYKDMKVNCELCGKMVKNTYYRHHISVHYDKRDYKCDVCPSSFTSYLFLYNHKKRHENPFSYKCDICPRAFSYSKSVKEHKRREHTNERPFQCDQCSYSSVAKGNLIRHLRTHTGERPFKCPVCENSFAEKKNVKRHIKKVHLRGDDKGEASTSLGVTLGNKRKRMTTSI